MMYDYVVFIKDNNERIIILWFDCVITGCLEECKLKKHFKAKHQKKRVFRSSDSILSVFMWGVNHTVSYKLYGIYTYTLCTYMYA